MVHLQCFVIIYSHMDGIVSKVTRGQKCLRHALLLRNVVPMPLAGLTGLIRQQKKAKSPKRSASAGAETAASGRSILKYLTAEVSSCITSKERPRNIHVIFVIVVLTEGIKVFEFPFFGTKKCVQTPILSSEQTTKWLFILEGTTYCRIQ